MFDWSHLKDNKTTYREHLCFSTGVALRLIPTVILLLVHGILPMLKMPKAASISGTSDYLFDKDYEIRQRVLGSDPVLKK
jgi:hypothetical protein